ncbi:heavy-metal-associated domain-containing protein [Caminicella sporogenes]|uniref:heavy-metal-associated domain-containing protein n=1 Tax=Caminicella sporogenes TaxID=166485 RepID=UPI0025416CDB|nr:heavy-metal-associated domain-containing protein [Caminicella sporogenes]WIF96158.1 heavy-metal-associated domain-containing protein [Caminicella sporogenes]
MILIEGMSCHHCKGRVERALGEIDGVIVESISVDEKNAIINLTKDVDESVIRQAIDDAGYDVLEIKEI